MILFHTDKPFCETRIISENNSLIKELENNLLKQEMNCLTKFKHESSNFYGLPKFRKPKTISKVIVQ